MGVFTWFTKYKKDMLVYNKDIEKPDPIAKKFITRALPLDGKLREHEHLFLKIFGEAKDIDWNPARAWEQDFYLEHEGEHGIYIHGRPNRIVTHCPSCRVPLRPLLKKNEGSICRKCGGCCYRDDYKVYFLKHAPSDEELNKFMDLFIEEAQITRAYVKDMPPEEKELSTKMRNYINNIRNNGYEVVYKGESNNG